MGSGRGWVMYWAWPPSRCGEQFAGDVVGVGSAEVLADDMETQLDAGGHARGGQQGIVVDVEDAAVHPDLGVEHFEFVGAGPVRGDRTAVEQPGRGQCEGAGADGGDAGASAEDKFQSCRDLGCRWPLIFPVAGHDDHVRPGQSRQSCCVSDREPGAGRDAATGSAAHREFVRGVGPRVEDLRRDAEIDGEHQGQHQDRDAMGSHGSKATTVTFWTGCPGTAGMSGGPWPVNASAVRLGREGDGVPERSHAPATRAAVSAQQWGWPPA
ncbi:hypothetical protein Save01_05748 [Streptomyces avermitilis]